MKIILLWDTLKDRITAIIILIAISFTASFAQQKNWNTGKLVITLSDVKSPQGTLKIALYNDASQWTDNPIYSSMHTKNDMSNSKITVTIDSLPRTIYAIAVLDDINDNNEMDFRLGLPTEGFGMSTNPSFFKLKPPEFEEVSFELDSPVLRMEVKMNYILRRKK